MHLLWTFCSISAAAITLTVSARAEPVEVFADRFETDSSSGWTVISGGPFDADWEVTFYYDYGAEGIPAAPNSMSGETRGVKVSVNHSSGSTYAVNLLPSIPVACWTRPTTTRR